MSYLTVAVIGLAVLGLVNLVFIVAMASRLREHSQQLARQGRPPAPPRRVGLPPGTLVPEFSVTTVSGAVVSTANLLGERSLIGFFMPGCVPCHNQLPAFLAFARGWPGGPGHVLAVVSDGGRPMERVPADDGDGLVRDVDGLVKDVDVLVRELAETDAVQVVAESAAKAAVTALAVKGYPSFIVLGADGRVEAGDNFVAGVGGLRALADSAGRSG
jgi:hypothetical protein